MMIAFFLGSVECAAQSATAETSSPVILPANTPVILRLKESLNKKDAKPGYSLEFEVGFDVVVNGQVVIQSGTVVTGSLRQVDKTGKGPARVLVDLGPAQTVSGEPVRLAGTTTTPSDQPGIADAVSVAGETGALFPVVMPVFVVMSLFEKKVLLDTHAVVAHVTENVALDPAKLKAAQAQLRESAPQRRLPETSRDKAAPFPDFFTPLFKAGLLEKAGDLDAAIDVYQQVLASKPDSSALPESSVSGLLADLHFGLAELFRQKPDFVHAIPEYRTAVQLGPEDERFRGGLVTALEDSGDPDAALAEIKEAIRIWPDKFYFHYLLGRVLVQKNDVDAAIVELQWALKKAKNHLSPANCELGRAFEQKGDLEAALRQYRAAFRVHVNDEQCRAAYERLKLELKK
jgi:Flp pilus assembly protein TadD